MPSDDSKKGLIHKERWLLILSLLLALFVWFLHSLSLNYTVYFQYKVNITSDILGYNTQSVSKESIVARCKSNGFYILKNRISGKVSELSAEVDSDLLTKGKNNVYYLSSTDLFDIISESYASSSFRIESIKNDSISFEITPSSYKKVPVEITSLITYRDQYTPIEPLKADPDSVIVYGYEQLLDNIDKVSTEPLKLQSINKSESGVLNLKSPKGLKLSQDEVFYSVKVERYVENSVTLPIKVINIPQSLEMIVLPSEVKLTYRASFGSKYDDNSLILYIDYEDFIKSESKHLAPILMDQHTKIYSYQTDPKVVDCLLIEK